MAEGKTDGLAKNETQTTSIRIWNRLFDFISYVDTRYAKYAIFIFVYVNY